jgi:adenylosuccinate synthase
MNTLRGQFPDSEDNTTFNLIFNGEITRWAHSIDLKDKSSATLKEQFTEYIAEVERQTGMKVKKLHVDGGVEYKGQLTPIPFKASNMSQLERRCEHLSVMVRQNA